MPTVFALNPGSNSLKFDLVEVAEGQQFASDGRKLLSGSIDNIGKEGKLALTPDGKTVAREDAKFADFDAALGRVVEMLESGDLEDTPRLEEIDLAAIRVVHGGDSFDRPVRV